MANKCIKTEICQFTGVDLNTPGSNLSIMGSKLCCNAKDGLNKCPWIDNEDLRLTRFIQAWPAPAKNAVLKRYGKSYRLRWVTYLRPNLNRATISLAKEELIIRLHKLLENWWSLIEGRISGSTDNGIKNCLNTRLSKKTHANACIGRLKFVRPTERNTAVSMTRPLNPNQLGERHEATQPVG